jgi:P-type Ca2+ transporter type 2C
VFIGSKTETALLKFAKGLGWAGYKDIRDATDVVLIIPFSSECKSVGCVVRLPDGVLRLFMKGASEILTRKMRYVIVHCDGATDAPGATRVETVPIGELEEDNISCTITSMLLRLCTPSPFVFGISEAGPPQGAQLMDDGEATISFVVKIPTADWSLAG